MLVFEAVMLVGQGEVLSHTIIALFKTVYSMTCVCRQQIDPIPILAQKIRPAAGFSPFVFSQIGKKGNGH